ncbi:MAG: hypothetical protein NVS1B6_20200 [Steroidobacteraceae bacterium]
MKNIYDRPYVGDQYNKTAQTLVLHVSIIPIDITKTLRYTFVQLSKHKFDNLRSRRGGLGSFEAHVQGSLMYQSSIWPDLRSVERAILGKQGAYGVADFTAGVARNGITAVRTEVSISGHTISRIPAMALNPSASFSNRF